MTWEIVDGNKLIIKGDGDMDDYSPELPPPWRDYEISSIEISEGVYYIGKGAFASELTKIKGIDELILPSSLKSIGDYAFANTLLPSIEFPETIQIAPTALMMYQYYY